MKKSAALVGILSLLASFAFAAAPAAPATAEPADHPCKIIETVRANYPIRMVNQGIKHGAVQVTLSVSEAGQLEDMLITAYTNKAFADEAEQVVKKWKYEAGIAGGRPIATIMSITFNFEVTGMIAIQRQDPVPLLNLDLIQGFAYQARGLKNLDRIPAPLSVVSPTYPQEWADQGITGSVTVDFFIDETGKTRMVSCLPGVHVNLASIATAAVEKWQFTPPTWKGEPVLVHARQVFTFGKGS